MANIPDDVKPGDLITAAFFIRVLTVLRDHETRLQKLEGAVTTTGNVVITQVVPSGPVHMGDELRLIGRNFGIPALNSININGTPVAGFKAGSGDTLLIFDIPTVQGILPQGQTATLNLSNSNGFASTTIFLLPGQPALPSGQLFVAMSQPPPDPLIIPSHDFVFVFAITGVTSLDETYTVSPTVDAGWAAVLVDNSTPPQVITPAQIFIPQGNPPQGVNTVFRVRVTVPPGTANNVTGQLRVAIASRLNPTGLNTTTQNLPLTVGSPPPGAQNAIVITVANVFQPGTNVGGVINVPANSQQVRVDFAAMIATAGSYVISAPSFANPTGWAAQLVGGTNFTTTGPNSNQLVTTVLTAAANAQATTMTVHITAANNAAVAGQLQQPLRAS